MRHPFASLLAVVTLVIGAACGGGDGVPPVGERLFIRAQHQWPDDLRRQLRLEPLNMEQLRAPCGLDVDVGEYTPGAEERTQDARVAQAMHGILGRDWGHVWFDRCDGGRLKVGVPLGKRTEVVREVERARSLLRERRVVDVTDLVAVPSPSPALAAAQDRIHAADVGEPDDLMSGQDHSLNAVHVEVARDVDPRGWRVLRRVAKTTGVNVILERVEANSLGIEPF